MEIYTIGLPTVILTDRELACMNALDQVFPSVPSMVCRWHTNRNVLAKTREVLGQNLVANPAPGQDKHENTWQTEVFMANFYKAVDADMEVQFNSQCALLHTLCLVLAFVPEYSLVEVQNENCTLLDKRVQAFRVSRYLHSRGNTRTMQALAERLQ